MSSQLIFFLLKCSHILNVNFLALITSPNWSDWDLDLTRVGLESTWIGVGVEVAVPPSLVPIVAECVGWALEGAC